MDDAKLKEKVLEQVKGMEAKINAQTKQMDEQKEILEIQIQKMDEQTKLLEQLLNVK